MSTTGGIKVFSGPAHRKVAEEICHELCCDLGKAMTARFSDGEFSFQIEENVRGADVFIVQPTCPPTDAYLMELLVMLDAFRRSSAERLTAWSPINGMGSSAKRIGPHGPMPPRWAPTSSSTASPNRILR